MSCVGRGVRGVGGVVVRGWLLDTLGVYCVVVTGVEVCLSMNLICRFYMLQKLSAIFNVFI